MADEPNALHLLTTNRKALVINLDATRYGTFAEIGAGQEVARHFFQAGGASGTVAKTMSAYDMAFSDAIYGQARRYVSEKRLLTMLGHEYALLRERLEAARGATTRFFVFADTVAARSYRGDNECHGWLGVRFQTTPGGPTSDILVHVRMWDRENLQQQQAIGVLGVNLLYGAFFTHEHPTGLIRSLVDGLGRERVEVDVVRFHGPAFADADARLLALQLVADKLTDAVVFGPEGDPLPPSEAFYKKAVLVQRGGFHPVTRLHLELMASARRRFIVEPTLADKPVQPLFEMAMAKLSAGGRIDTRDFLDRVDALAAEGAHVLVSNDLPYYRLTAYFRRYTPEMIGFAMGARALAVLFDEARYENLDGGILEAFGRMFKASVRLYVYPRLDPAGAPALLDAEKVAIPPKLGHLRAFLIESGLIETLRDPDRDALAIFAHDALASIRDGTGAWESMVPPAAAALIRRRRLFGLAEPAPQATSRPG